MPGVNDPLTYFEKARALVMRTDGARLRGSRFNLREFFDQSGSLIRETFYMDPATGEFVVIVDSGEELGALKTYFVKDGSVVDRIRYF